MDLKLLKIKEEMHK